MSKVLLLTPPYHTGIIEVTGKWTPTSLVYLAGALRKAGHQPIIHDAMTLDHTDTEIVAKVLAERPAYVLIGAYTASILAALETLRCIKEVAPSVITVLGGVHASFCYNDILVNYPWVDYVVRGEGEITIVDLLATLNEGRSVAQVKGIAYREQDKVSVTEDRPLIEDINTLEPAWDLLDWSKYYFSVTDARLAVVSSSRGCNHQCSFCSQHRFWRGAYRERSPQNFVAELEYLAKEFGVQMCMFSDEYSTKNRERFEAILDLLIERNLGIHFSLETRAQDIVRDRDILHKYRQAGIIHIYVGVESTNQSVLDAYNKESSVEVGREAITLLNEAGIITECSFILGDLDETPERIDQTLALAMEISPDLAHFLLITPWPYTSLYEQVKDHIVEHDFGKYHLVHPIIKPVQMSTELLWQKLINCFAVFYMQKTKQYLHEPDSFKRRYMLKSVQIMHNHFFTTNFGHNTIKMPAVVGEVIAQALDEAGDIKDTIFEDYKVNSVKGGYQVMGSGQVITAQELDQQIKAFIAKGLDNHDEEEFNRLALLEFEHQYANNTYYRDLCTKFSVSPATVTCWDQIPPVPTQAFKETIVASFPLENTEIALLTSGTSNPNMRGKIYRDKSSLEMIIQSNSLATKYYLFPDVERMKMLLMVPSPKVAPAMSMAFGLEQSRQEFGTEDSVYLITPNGLEVETLVKELRKAESTGELVCIMGATSGFVHFFNYCKQNNMKFSLPKGCRVCDGGGYQGTFGDCTRDEFYQLCEEYLGIQPHYNLNILGMSESGSNYFDNVLRNYLDGNPEIERSKVVLPWTRTIVVGARTGQRMPKGEVGLIRHYDLTNRATVFAVQTDNIGYETEAGFEIIGRAGGQIYGFAAPTATKDMATMGQVHPAHQGHPQGMPMGHPANIPMGHPHSMGMANMQGMPPHDMLGLKGHPGGMAEMHPGGPAGGCQSVSESMIGKGAHSHPCSTVADEMMKAHSHPCSTVADEMMMKAHSHPCSTVADQMMMKAHSHPCSTVADQMMIKAHSHPCSTVADEMMKAHSHPCSTVADEMMSVKR